MPGTTDTVKAMLTPGEFVIRKEAVDMIGVPILEKLNDMPEAGGHSEIDRLIAMATLKTMTGMYGGGMVNAKQYMGGGMVNEYQDGGSVSDATATNLMNMLYEQSLPTQNNYGSLQDQDRIDMVNQAIIDSATGTGSIRNIAKSALSKSAMPNLKEFISGLFKKSYKGKIAPNAEIPEKLRGKSLYRYPDGSFDYLGYKGKYSPTEEIPESLLKKRRIQYDDGSFDIDPLDVSGYKHGGKVHKNLKPIPKDNPGLAKLPEDVRNKMGYMQEGGKVEDSLMGMMYGGKAKKKKKYGYQEGGSVDSNASNYLNYILETTPPDTMKSIMETGFRTAPKELFEKASAKTDSLMSAEKERQKMLMEQYPELFQENQEPVKKGFLKKLLGMQEGGAVQDDAMMLQYLQSLQAQQANPFVPFDQRPPSSGEMMSPIPSGMEQGDMMRIIRDEREVLNMQDAELLRQKAQNALMRFKLDSIINAEGLQPERLESMPVDTSEFMPSSLMFSPRDIGI